nr:MAG: hypothetical protein 3 [Leviviridae sp.]
MKIPTKLLYRVLLDVGLQVSDTIDFDYREICSRYEKEGLSFLTITLPSLDDALLKGLARGRLCRSDYVGFSQYKRSGSLPRLLSGFFKRIFHSDGSIMDEPDVRAIIAIRQVSRLFKKVEKPCSDARVKAAYERYVSNDRGVDWRHCHESVDLDLFSRICGSLWSDLEDRSAAFYCRPGIFGIGATAEKKKRNQRYSVSEWPVRAENYFPCSYHAVHREDSDALMDIRFLTEEQELPVRVVQVPKTLKTPRTISVEPSYMMLMQQSIAKSLMVYLESNAFGFQSIRFTDQSVNSNLARLGSIDGRYATIDLKDASDLIDNDLVRFIFERHCPTFFGFIQACRSTRAKLPDNTIIPLRKFASMGSALCFPIESMVFFTIVLYAIVKATGKVPSKHNLRKISKDVAIYGDDIIVKSMMAQNVMTEIEAFGLKVNHDKSFSTGLFRESCGGDYYAGVDVTPVYVRQWDDTGTLRDATQRVAYVALSNSLYMKGMWHASQYLRDAITLRIKHRIPLSQHPIGVLHFISFVRSDGLSYDSKLHGYRVKGVRVCVRKESDSPSDMGGFLYRAFQPRYFREWLSEYENSLRCESLISNLTARGGFENCYGKPFQFALLSYPEIFRASKSSTHGKWEAGFLHKEVRRLFDLALSPGEPSEVHGRLLPWSRWTLDMGSRTAHLSGGRGSSLTHSDRPHALCLKRGWTASPAGLNW